MSPTAPPRRPAVRVDALDGIRTLAVFLVVAFHVGVPGMAGGFLGVDIFFVLSGYLITTLLLKDLSAHGRIDLAHFWTRRFLRLMPAAVLVIATVVVWAYLVAEPYRRAAIGTDALWSLLYVGNWRFISSASYFDDDGTSSPLQHVWSLAVEEQFYVAWPLVLAVAAALALRAARRRTVVDSAERLDRERRRRATVLRTTALTALVIGIGSAVLLWVLYDPAAPDRAYMGTDTKVFEPLLGALFATLTARPRARAWFVRHSGVLMVIGIGGVAAGVVTLGGPSPWYFAGGAVAFSLCCAVLVTAVTAAGDRHPLARGFATAPVAYLGRISYGMYLWHWPFAVWFITEPGFVPHQAALVVALTIVTASLSYHLVEHPIRTGALARIRPRHLLPVGIGTLAAVVMSTAVLAGSPVHRALQQVQVVSGTASHEVDPDAIVVVGDSVMGRLVPGLDTVARGRGVTVYNAARGGCPALTVPALDIDDTLLAGGQCTERMRDIQDDTIAQARPATIVWWSRYELSDRLDDDGTILRAGTSAFWEAQRRSLAADVDRLTASGAVLVLVQTDRPGIGLHSRCTPERCHPFLDRLWHRDDLRVEWNAILAEVAEHDRRVETLTIDDVFCRDEATPCDDHLDSASAASSGPSGLRTPATDASPGIDYATLARPDGSHFSDAAAPRVATSLLDRVQALADR
ncbi:MAG: acyltransferase family protein [Mobilicoccus sp.]|nr:acyltransferase family protein [Mobilicoccus sp.]